MKQNLYGVVVLGLLFLAGCMSYVARGDQAAATGDWDRAYQFYAQAAATDPAVAPKLEQARLEAFGLHRDLAVRAENQQNYELAIHEYRRAHSYQSMEGFEAKIEGLSQLRDQAESQKHSYEGDQSLQAGRLTAARAQYEAALAAWAGNSQARQGLVEVQAREQTALEMFDRAKTAAERGQTSSALAIYKEGLVVWSDHRIALQESDRLGRRLESERLLAEGAALESQGQWAEAANRYRAAAALLPSPEVSARLASLERRIEAQAVLAQAEKALLAGQLVEGLNLAQRAVDLDPSNPAATQLLAQTEGRVQDFERFMAQAAGAENQGQLAQAHSAYEQALFLWPNHPEALAGRERVGRQARYVQYIAAGEKALAQGDWRRALEMFQTAQTQVDTQHVRERIAYASFRVELESHIQAARSLHGAGQLTAAEAAIARALALDPANPEAIGVSAAIDGSLRQAHNLLGGARIARQNCQWAEAIRQYESVLAVWRDSTEAAEGLAYCRAQLGWR